MMVVLVGVCAMGTDVDGGEGMHPEPQHEPAATHEQQFEDLLAADWEEAFFDPCTQDWEANWFLDGLKAKIMHRDAGMEFYAGDQPGDHAGHAVLWTRGVFAGDLKIEYEYTRLDQATQCVTILYIQASGSGEAPYVDDIFAWRDLRTEPWMRLYFNHMKTYHISYAAFDVDNHDTGWDYVRARRYRPTADKGLVGTALQPDYSRTGLFATGVPHKITVIKSGDGLYMHVRGVEASALFHWDTSTHEGVDAGRIGFRHMFTRAARYRNVRVSRLLPGDEPPQKDAGRVPARP